LKTRKWAALFFNFQTMLRLKDIKQTNPLEEKMKRDKSSMPLDQVNVGATQQPP